MIEKKLKNIWNEEKNSCNLFMQTHDNHNFYKFVAHKGQRQNESSISQIWYHLLPLFRKISKESQSIY